MKMKQQATYYDDDDDDDEYMQMCICPKSCARWFNLVYVYGHISHFPPYIYSAMSTLGSNMLYVKVVHLGWTGMIEKKSYFTFAQ